MRTARRSLWSSADPRRCRGPVGVRGGAGIRPAGDVPRTDRGAARSVWAPLPSGARRGARPDGERSRPRWAVPAGDRREALPYRGPGWSDRASWTRIGGPASRTPIP